MKGIFALLLFLVCTQVLAQNSSGGGIFPTYKKNGITKVEEYYFNIENPTNKESIPKRTLLFDSLGRMIQEQFNQNRIKSSYSYSYNNEGFISNIDTNGLFIYSNWTYSAYTDTISILENWFAKDTIRRLISSEKHFIRDSLHIKTELFYDSLGNLTKELIYEKKGLNNYSLFHSTFYEYNHLNLLIKKIRKDEEKDQIIDVEEFRYFSTTKRL